MANFPIVFAGPSESVTNRVTQGLIALWEFDNLVGGDTVEDLSGVSPLIPLTVDTPANVTQGDTFLTIDAEARLHSGGAGTATKLYDRITPGEEFTLEMWYRPTVVSGDGSTGPARLMTMSNPAAGTTERNFLLGQGEFTGALDDHLRARVRSNVTSEDGSFTSGPPLVTPDGTLVAGTLYHVAFVCRNVAEDADEKQLEVHVNAVGSSFSLSPSAAAEFLGSFLGGAVAWDRDFELNVANENDSDATARFLRAELHLAAIYDRALDSSEIEVNFYAGPDGGGDVPLPSMEWDQAGQTISEVHGTLTVPAVLSGPRSYEVRATVEFGGDASEGADYTEPLIRTVVFAPFQTQSSIDVPILHDMLEDGDKTLTLTLSGPTNGTLGTNSVHTVTIEDSDQTPTVAFVESSSSRRRPLIATIPIELDRPYFSDVEVGIRTVVASSVAEEGVDFDLVGDSADGTVTIPAGSTVGFVEVQTIANGGGDELLTLEIHAATIGGIGSQDRHELTIQEESAAGGTMQSSVSYLGFTWTFDQPYLVGSYVCGDPWVVGPCTVVSVSPAPDAGFAGSNGSLVNPDVRKSFRLDSRNISGRPVADYDPGPRASFPLAMSPDESLLSAESWDPLPGSTLDVTGKNAVGNFVLKRAAVLTCVDTARPATEFRPALIGTDKTRYDSAALSAAALPRFAAPATITPSITPRDPGPSMAERFAVYFRRPWVLINFEWLGRFMHPTENQPNYHGDSDKCCMDALLLLCSDIPVEQKQPLLEGVLQVAIDMRAGYVTGPDSTDKVAMKAFMLLAADLLSAPEFSDAYTSLKTEYMHYYPPGSSTITSSVIPSGGVWTGYTGQPSGSGIPAFQHNGPGINEHEHLEYQRWDEVPANDPDNDNHPLSQERYRSINSAAHAGIALAARMLGLDSAWAKPAFFDYADRWMDDPGSVSGQAAAKSFWGGGIQGGPATGTWSPFADAMWASHRSSL